MYYCCLFLRSVFLILLITTLRCLLSSNVFPLNNVPVVCVQHESLGPTGGFSHYVFKKLHESKQFSELLRLGEEFPEELSIFLKEHPDLLWLHDLFLHHFSSASETLHTLALAQNVQSTAVTEEKEQVQLKLKLTDRKNLLYLSKIAAFAGI